MHFQLGPKTTIHPNLTHSKPTKNRGRSLLLKMSKPPLQKVSYICAIENLDPMGVHTGDSITIAPAMTLSDVEYQSMRNEAIEIGAGAIANGIDLQSQLEHSSATIEGCRQELTDTVSRMEQNLDETVGTLEAKRQTEMEEATARHAATTTELEATTDKVQALEKQLSASTTKADDLQELITGDRSTAPLWWHGEKHYEIR